MRALLSAVVAAPATAGADARRHDPEKLAEGHIRDLHFGDVLFLYSRQAIRIDFEALTRVARLPALGAHAATTPRMPSSSRLALSAGGHAQRERATSSSGCLVDVSSGVRDRAWLFLAQVLYALRAITTRPRARCSSVTSACRRTTRRRRSCCSRRADASGGATIEAVSCYRLARRTGCRRPMRASISVSRSCATIASPMPTHPFRRRHHAADDPGARQRCAITAQSRARLRLSAGEPAGARAAGARARAPERAVFRQGAARHRAGARRRSAITRARSPRGWSCAAATCSMRRCRNPPRRAVCLHEAQRQRAGRRSTTRAPSTPSLPRTGGSMRRSRTSARATCCSECSQRTRTTASARRCVHGWFRDLEGPAAMPPSAVSVRGARRPRLPGGSSKNYRDMVYLGSTLARWGDSMDAFQDMIDTRERAYAERLPRVDGAARLRRAATPAAARRVARERAARHRVPGTTWRRSAPTVRCAVGAPPARGGGTAGGRLPGAEVRERVAWSKGCCT